MPEYTQSQIVQQLQDFGVKPGGVLLVHCAFSKVKPVEGGPHGLIGALRSALGSGGTLVMPSLADDDERPFDPRETPCMDMGVVAETFRKMPRVLRSDSPHAFSAVGPHAAAITSPHPLDFPHGLGSPVGRVYELDGQVLLLGVDHTSNTTIHLAEALAGVRYRRKKHLAFWSDGRVAQLEYEEIDHCCKNFRKVDDWLNAKSLQTIGKVGNASARLIRSRDIITVVTEQLKQDETAFLHPFGVDEECDEARASIPG